MSVPLIYSVTGEVPMMRRTLLTASVVLIVGALAPELPAEARMDPTAFINNLGHQLPDGD
jgi:hypothetical protein